MFISDSKTLHDVAIPLLYFNCFIGMGSFRHANQSKAAYSIMKIHTVCFTVINWIMIYVTLNSMIQVKYPSDLAPIAFRIYQAITYANSCITVIAPFLVWLRRKALSDCMRQMLILDDTCQTLRGARNEYRKEYIRMMCKIMVIFVAVCLVGIFDIIHMKIILLKKEVKGILMSWVLIHSLHHPLLVMLVLDLNFCFFLGYLGKKFRDLNDSLLGLTKKSSTSHPGKGLFKVSRQNVKWEPGTVRTDTESEGLMNDRQYSLREIRKTHLKLCKLSQKINHAFGIQNLLSTGLSFVMITGLLYTVFSAFEWRDPAIAGIRSVIPSVTWTAIYVSKIWMSNHASWAVSNEAGATGAVIYEILDSKVDREFQKEIKEFGLQILQNPVRFNVCGFFTLDYTFVQGVIGSITTYLVILIQMSHSSKPRTINSLFNNTEI